MLRPSCSYGDHKPVSTHPSAAGAARSYDGTGSFGAQAGLRRGEGPSSPRREVEERRACSACCGASAPRRAVECYASRWHFCMKLRFAAPASARPSLPTALATQASRLHFFRKLVLAAPARGLPSLLTALLSQVSCAEATAKFRDSTRAASRIRFMSLSFLGSPQTRYRASAAHERRAATGAVCAPLHPIRSAQPLSCLLHSL